MSLGQRAPCTACSVHKSPRQESAQRPSAGGRKAAGDSPVGEKLFHGFPGLATLQLLLQVLQALLQDGFIKPTAKGLFALSGFSLPLSHTHIPPPAGQALGDAGKQNLQPLPLIREGPLDIPGICTLLLQATVIHPKDRSTERQLVSLLHRCFLGAGLPFGTCAQGGRP